MESRLAMNDVPIHGKPFGPGGRTGREVVAVAAIGDAIAGVLRHLESTLMILDSSGGTSDLIPNKVTVAMETA